MKFYSESLNKMFDSADACAEAESTHEKAMAEAEAKKKALADERANRAKEVEEAYKTAVDAKQNYDAKLREFLRDYGSFHFTYRSSENPFSTFFDLF